jgi:hypothetical protein
MKSTPNPLPGVSRQMVEEVLELVRKYLNAIQIHYDQSETGYEHFIMTASDGEALISMLKYGLLYDQLIQERNMALLDWEESDWKDA